MSFAFLLSALLQLVNGAAAPLDLSHRAPSLAPADTSGVLTGARVQSADTSGVLTGSRVKRAPSSAGRKPGPAEAKDTSGVISG